MRYIMTYVTCANRQEAEKIASVVVEAHLAACANIIDGMESLYWWKGKLEKNRECILIFKTEERLFGRLQERILALHSYETPCVVALPIADGNKAYLDWISASVSESD